MRKKKKKKRESKDVCKRGYALKKEKKEKEKTKYMLFRF